ncbi:MAG: TIGR00266 family protein [Peptostreptococcaceae bacterium]|nr:TIGR00266 family protein [Peptostreptococcaceae bacterium]MDY5739503.1 TIGR00266 family protein [Anaerovoracaceae bacterium]
MKYEIKGGNLPVVICKLSSGEKIITEGGGMSWMTPNMEMSTSGGGMGKMFGKMLSGEALFQNIYTCNGGEGEIAFASSFPGEIRAFEVSPGRDMILQKSAFLASEASVQLSTFFNKKLGAGFFGGEGFIMQKISGNGIVFAEFDGSVEEYTLGAGESMILDTGHLAAMESTCTMEIVTVKGLKNKLLGGEGFFNTKVTGPGKIYIQTMPLSNIASMLAPYFVTGK